MPLPVLEASKRREKERRETIFNVVQSSTIYFCFPCDIKTSWLKSFNSHYKHYVKRTNSSVLMGTDGDETEHESLAAASQEESMLSLSGLARATD